MSTELTTDVSSLLSPGVLLLGFRGRIVYVGKARCLLTALDMHRKRAGRVDIPDAIKTYHFDHIEIIPCDVRRAEELRVALIALHNPIHNRPAPTGQTLDQILGAPLPFPVPQTVRRI